MKTSKRLQEVKERCCSFNVNFPDDIIDSEHFNALDKAISYFKEKECKADKFFKTITSYKQHESEEQNGNKIEA